MTKGSSIYVDFEGSATEQLHQRQTAADMSETYENMKSLRKFCGGCANSTDSDIMICDGRSISKNQDTANYAQILTRKPCSELVTRKLSWETKTTARRTRESENPILRLSAQNCDVVVAETEDDNQPKLVTKDDLALKRSAHVNGHEKIQYSRSDSEIVYENSDDFNDNLHLYENFDDRMKSRGAQTSLSMRSSTSNETSETESLYEDLDDVYEAMLPPQRITTVSKPIDIVYTSIDFSGRCNSSPVSVGSCTTSASLGSLDRAELRRCSSYCYGNIPLGGGKPPELPQRYTKRQPSTTRARGRPQSLHLENEAPHTKDFGLGLYTGTLVGTYIVMKTSPKSVQKIIGDFLAREKKEQSKPVSFEVTTEQLTLSLNCAPWNVLAENNVDDIGCVTTYSASNKTALGYTISKPGEDTRLFVLHCSDANQIKEAILRNFKRPTSTSNSLSRWSSLSALGTLRSRGSRSLPRMSSSRSRTSELASFDELVYLGSHKVKKSFLVINDNISYVLDHKNSKDYTVAKIELYKDAIHLKNSKQDRLLDIHKLEWILSVGLFDEDRRYFGYISSKAFQGSKTRTSCHVFRCDRVGLASQIMEVIRHACQATYLARTCAYPPEFRSRTNSNASTSSEGSVSSNSETMSLGSTGSSPPEFDWSQTRVRKRPNFLQKRMSRNRMTTIQSFREEDSGIDVFQEDTPSEKDTPLDEKPQPTKLVPDENTQPAGEKILDAPKENPATPENVPQIPEQDTLPPLDEKPQQAKCEPELEPRPPTPKVAPEKRFSVFYLCSTIVSPPLKPKHVKDCLKQYQKSVDKAMKKCTENRQHYKKCELVLNANGVMLIDNQTQTPQAFYERAVISGVQSHPDGKCAFAFTTVVSGNTKHKCHLFLQDKDPIGDIIREVQAYIS